MTIFDLKHIETPRLVIRPVQRGDEIELNAAIQRSLLSLQRWMHWAKDPSLETTLNYVEESVRGWSAGHLLEFPMIVIHKADRKIISASGFNEKSDLSKRLFEIGYWIDTPYEGQGYVSELVNALTRYALEALQATRVQICTQVGNEKSMAVAKRCGYVCGTTLKSDRLDCESGLPVDSFLYVCGDLNALPALTVTWKHRKN